MSNAAWNATVSNSTGFGASDELDLITGAPYGTAPVDGVWKAAIHTQITGVQDALSLELSSTTTAGTSYRLRFAGEDVQAFDPGNGFIEVGLSASASSFGTLVFTGDPGVGGWTLFDTTFVAPIAADYLTVRSSALPVQHWDHVDAFDLTVVPEPASFAVLGLGALALLRRRRK